MRIGQTSFVYFISRVTASILGFFATVYFARLLGAETLGKYYLVLALVAWLQIAGVMGINGAVNKRLSEGEERGEYLSAGALVILTLFIALSVLLVLFGNVVDSYIGSPVTGVLTMLLFSSLFYVFAMSVLNGHQMVHVTGILIPVKTAVQSVLQIGAVVLFSLSLTGLILGYAAGWLFVGSVGILIVAPSVRRPAWRHFRELFNFAKYAWIGSLQRRSFTWLDIMVLGVFVQPRLVGIYSICWNIVSLLTSFSLSISTTTFPQISEMSKEEQNKKVSGIVSDSLTFAGLLLIPGLVGGSLLAERILVIYSAEFIQGGEVLWILIVGGLLYGYQKQMTTALNGIDRPDVTFRINLVFLVSIVVSNVALVWAFGWVGAAVATALSTGVGTVLSYASLRRLLNFKMPFGEVGRQGFAAAIMGLVIYSGLWIENTYRLLQHNVATVVLVIVGGAVIYFAVLFGISTKFRLVVSNNLHFDLPVFLR